LVLVCLYGAVKSTVLAHTFGRLEKKEVKGAKTNASLAWVAMACFTLLGLVSWFVASYSSHTWYRGKKIQSALTGLGVLCIGVFWYVLREIPKADLKDDYDCWQEVVRDTSMDPQLEAIGTGLVIAVCLWVLMSNRGVPATSAPEISKYPSSVVV
jgi:hypothetical protein